MNRYDVHRTEQEGLTVIELYDRMTDGKANILPEVGNNLIAYAQGGVPVIAPPIDFRPFARNRDEWFKHGTPILFPPNRIPGGTLPFNGKVYRLPINEPPDTHLHGEVSRKAWEIVEIGASPSRGARLTCRFDFAAHPEIMAYFPHELAFTVTHSLCEGRLSTDIAIANNGRDAAPFAFGLHPYFAVPSGTLTELTIPAKMEWPVTNRALVTGTPSATPFCESLNNGIDTADFPELGCALVRIDGEHRICRFAAKDEGYRIAYEIDRNFPFVLLFRPDWAESFSLEPYTYVTDAFNLPYSAELTGARSIEPGETVRLRTAMWVERMDRSEST